jgi:hypothetical protein
VAYWIALALHLGTPSADGYAKLSTLKVPEWLATAEPRARPAESRKQLETRLPLAPAPYEKLSTLKTY